MIGLTLRLVSPGASTNAFSNWALRAAACCWIVLGASASIRAEAAELLHDGEARAAGVGVYGAVQRPAQLPLESSSSMSIREAIASAGGIAPDGYPFGAILLRRDRSDGSAVVIPTVRRCVGAPERQAMAVIDALFGVDDRREWARRIASRQFFRVPVDLRTAMDTDAGASVLIDGDVLIIPPRQAYVFVSEGMALESAPALYEPGRSADYYAEQVGVEISSWWGRDLLTLPNGEVHALGLKFWNYSKKAVPPGALVIVGAREAACASR